MDAVSQGSHF